MKAIFSKARTNIGAAQVVQKQSCDKTSLRETRFNVGDQVHTFNTTVTAGHSQKLHSVLKGHFIITQVISQFLYKVPDTGKPLSSTRTG